ncbi:hypothetical protein A3K48_04565 [candidate division WOR-1 bacterium RIFOXYA12_FULL_52_29]|uniref:GH26 domain-containing protein n=1 Tax=candidate division WOR-1 bacterium RIFOXYC12_FULL_54_18 TaxID=1802584 RepID=A0A1F4T8I6_UNCSA|nr:MAG: hypothetical protein A3K44_04565 [candidate division WOR-1 bacterium RIFOXYA2_FULL_51_19]OGC18500.1 MAG: hypothetical protein A3K48_04565 [candidate division WOR-1 bacterium RIFOXYA12_FULL_52_29]OGC27357.1 MAG: hypothetical protein A3K32_04560 [candidate division WOR-1 bacterium RIFOXYB2_FULL_45_9]OGC28917.1 MAG: hypothetical protein A3K49_04565 [candidate division WOR-1 bacterium RIFOXYC12_FULL_54_18]OGC30035.1 MAG: hypothetical protein A2346_01770 [candidate division WOR-1 bacterium R
MGAFTNGLDNLSAFQSTVGRNLAVVLWYVSWEEPFPKADADKVAANGSVPLITWEPWISASAETLEAIASGSHESYVRAFFLGAKEWGKPLFLRFGHEMNGNWYPWDGTHSGGATGPEKYKRAWRYIYNIKKSLGADNVTMVWSPNHANLPTESWNTVAAYYPGDEYVDWLGIDGYNWGNGEWQEFGTIFNATYLSLTALSARPLMIGEFACAETGGDKAAWIGDAFNKMRNDYPRIKLFNWFNINKERDWRVESSPTSASAARNALQDGYFLDKILR